MADFPSPSYGVPPILTSFHKESLGPSDSTPLAGLTLGLCTSSAWPTNNKAYYYPFSISDWGTAYQLLFWVGATSSGNIDVGIYDAQKHLIVSAGSTAMSATVNTVQELDIANTVLPPGNYLLAASCSTTVGTCFRGTGHADEIRIPAVPVYEETSALPLPATATPVAMTAATLGVFVVGIQLRSVF